ncbi:MULTISPECIES: DUF2884 family protein [unclassified Xenorhabdus]|uniref:DUF2884 family protein n=1 Tax=Xenorhabdus TaxID=626 RepID=UPI000C0546A3|nr:MULTISPECIES: DUF2884 family protein [unclassified Xenorhabdus]MCC8378828.1 DUF2884 family protein [Xenorhabdus sp. PB30.3]PHM55914.1 hypothetical protein Xekk_01996 [Xenorhabdus sp. KK7.4]PHM59613.1 hypothetical protein Xekk_00027 [Xenorhabdus sp. KK7.4]
MLRKIVVAASLVFAVQAQAGSECRTTLKDDIIVTADSVQMIGENRSLKIMPDGSVFRNGKALSLNADQRSKAKQFQQLTRQDLPWVKKEALNHLTDARQALDKVVTETMGKDSNIRVRLTQLESGLNKQIDKVLEARPDGIFFHYKAIKQIETEGKDLIQQSLGGILQDSINEMSRKTSNQNGDGKQMLMSLLGGLGGMQNGFEAEWKKQEKELKRFKGEVCDKANKLEQLRTSFLNSIN